jgi:hypothetical protein
MDRILQLAKVTLRKAQKLSKKVLNTMLDVILGEAVAYFGLDCRPKPQLEGDLR